MMNERNERTLGKLIAIEGLDGSGKETQSKLLLEALTASGVKAVCISFPDYESKSSEPVKMYLSGELGTSPGDTGAYAASSLFAVDRLVAFRTKHKDIAAHPDTVIIANRYTTANAYHQLSKLPESEWDAFLAWLWDFEFGKLGLPEPAGTVMLSLSPEISARLIEKRCEQNGIVKDIHEADMDYLASCRRASAYVSEKMNWTVIDCGDGNGEIRSREEIHKDVCRAASKVLGVTVSPVR